MKISCLFINEEDYIFGGELFFIFNGLELSVLTAEMIANIFKSDTYA